MQDHSPADGVIIVDGTNLVHRAYAVATKVQGLEEGNATAATVMGASLLVSRLTHYPEHWGKGATWVVFDLGGDSGRRAKYPQYKDHDREHSASIKDACDALALTFAGLGMRVYQHPDYEADDLIATLHRRATGDGQEVVIVSTDADLRQLVGERTSVRIPLPRLRDTAEGEGEPTLGYRLMGLPGFWNDYGFAPRLLPDYKALCGDTGEYPGVKGIGATWAQRLVATYGGLDAIFARAQEVGRKQVREALSEGEGDAYLFRELATLRTDVPLPEPVRWSGRTIGGVLPDGTTIQVMPMGPRQP